MTTPGVSLPSATTLSPGRADQPALTPPAHRAVGTPPAAAPLPGLDHAACGQRSPRSLRRLQRGRPTRPGEPICPSGWIQRRHIPDPRRSVAGAAQHRRSGGLLGICPAWPANSARAGVIDLLRSGHGDAGDHVGHRPAGAPANAAPSRPCTPAPGSRRGRPGSRSRDSRPLGPVARRHRRNACGLCGAVAGRVARHLAGATTVSKHW
jgi:hypothetical protein